jgi:hypothetical protein
MRWRPLLFGLHRDAGFLILGLTLAYAISGVAVNHKHHWDYNYSTRIERLEPGPPESLVGDEAERSRPWSAAERGKLTRERQALLVQRLRATLGRSDEPRAVFWRGPDRLSLFFGEDDRDVVDYQPSSGAAEHTVRSDRFLLRWLNILHLNERRKVWTWVADLYALLLAFMALSGVFLVKGRKSLWGRGGILALVGILLPVLLLLVFG